MITITDIAKRLGISISTVSKGLNGASDISEEMRQLVLDTALEMGYVNKNKKTTTKHKVAIFIENMDYANINHFGYEIITSFRLCAAEHQYEVSVIPIDLYMQTAQTYDELMNQNSFAGAFILGFELNDIYIDQLNHTTIPTVLFDNYIANKHIGYIGSDNTNGITMLVKHLHENGHRKIAFLNGRRNSYISQIRYKAYCNAMDDMRLSVDEALVGYGDFAPETAKTYVSTFLEHDATAIICASDLIASGVINELYRLGKRVPNDVSVTGFDDLPIAKYLAPPLTTIRQERFTLGKMAFILLSSLIEGIPISTLLIQSELIIRESVGPIQLHSKESSF